MYKAHRCQISPLLSDLQVSRLYKFSNPGTCLILFLFRCHNWRSSGPTLTSRVASRSQLNMTSQVYTGTGRGRKTNLLQSPPPSAPALGWCWTLELDSRVDKQWCGLSVDWDQGHNLPDREREKMIIIRGEIISMYSSVHSSSIILLIKYKQDIE